MSKEKKSKEEKNEPMGKRWALTGGLAMMAAVAGCTVGVDGDYVGLGGAVVGAESASLERGSMSGEGLGLDLEGDARHLQAQFTVETGAGPRTIVLDLYGPILAMLHGAEGGEARLRIEGLGGDAGFAADFVLVEGLDGTHELRFEADTGNETVQGVVVLRFVEGHC